MLFQRVARVGQVQGEITIVGQQEQSTGVDVQASNGVDALAAHVRGQEVKYGWPSLRVAGGAEIASGFMQQNVHLLCVELDGFSIDGDAVAFGIDARALRRYDLSVDAYAPRFNQQFGVTARSDTCMGEVARQSLSLRWLLCHITLPTTKQAAQRFSR